jgi:large subunit ribosomal protein L1
MAAKSSIKEKVEKKSSYTPPNQAPSKRFKSLKTKVENRAYLLDEALETVKKLANAKFDEAIEAHFRLGIDPKQTSQQVRSSVVLPHGTGKKLRILVFAQGDSAEEARKGGATIFNEEITSAIEKGSVPFDVVIATPDMMPQIARFARSLGVRGLMPNPKNGTVTNDVAKALSERSSGLVDFKNESILIQLRFGKASFSKENLRNNFVALLESVQRAKPAKISKEYLKSISIASTMGPGIKIDITQSNKHTS